MDNCSDCGDAPKCNLKRRKNSLSSNSVTSNSYISYTDSDMSEDDVNDQYKEYYKDDGKVAKNKHELVQNINELKKQKEHFSRPIDKFSLSKSLYEAILYPEKAKGFKFPAPFQTCNIIYIIISKLLISTKEFILC
jgi:hypothetical protein